VTEATVPPPDPGFVWDEIKRIRERVHQLFSYTAALKMRADDVDQWRTKADHRIERNSDRIDELEKGDEIADAVAAKIRARGRLELSVVQKIAGIVVFATSVAVAVKVLFFG
jgi:hypothetical protein